MVRFLAKGTQTHGPELSPAKMDLPWYFSSKRKMLKTFFILNKLLKVGDRRLKCRKGAWSSTPPLCAGGNCDSSLIPQVTFRLTSVLTSDLAQIGVPYFILPPLVFNENSIENYSRNQPLYLAVLISMITNDRVHHEHLFLQILHLNGTFFLMQDIFMDDEG